MLKQQTPLYLFPIAVLIEIVLLVLVGQWTGGLWVIGWTILSFFIGTRVWASLRDGGPLSARAFLGAGGALDATLVTEAAVDSMLVGLAGLLLVIPGLVTDLVGLVLLLPSLRRPLVASLLTRAMGRPAQPRSRSQGSAGTRESSRPGKRADRSPHATIDVEVIQPEHAPPSPFEHAPRIINVEPGPSR